MELGNMLFGNSRGEAPIECSDDWERPWEQFCEALGINWRGYPEDVCNLPTNAAGEIETDIFHIRSYDWDASCTCGAEAAMEEWHQANAHADACYQSELVRRFSASGCQDEPLKPLVAEVEEVAPGVTIMSFGGDALEGDTDWGETPHGKRMKRQDRIAKALCKERGLPYPNGSRVHCDCGHDERAAEHWEKIVGGHTPSCRLVQPNFLYKPTGFRINWYKYPFRDSYMTPRISGDEWRTIIQHCIKSASARA
jgi:hypothetical protein